jgi:U2 small nuclear ribonucleoprotein B''
MLFSTYGPVLDVVTMRNKMRGQAHVVYRDIQTSTQAMRALQGFELLGKEMQISYAKGQSQIIPKLRGTFEPPATAETASEATDLQKSIFNAPPSSVPAVTTSTNGLKSNEAGLPPLPQGVKRPREEEEEAAEESDAPMEEDDDDAPMEDSDSD